MSSVMATAKVLSLSASVRRGFTEIDYGTQHRRIDVLCFFGERTPNPPASARETSER
jgi:hypothetical protein